MAIDVCVESYGLLAHAFEVGVLDSALSIRQRATHQMPARLRGRRAQHHVRQAASELPIELLYVLWLVDVCGATYTQAAEEAGTTPTQVALQVAEARRRILVSLSDTPVPTDPP